MVMLNRHHVGLLAAIAMAKMAGAGHSHAPLEFSLVVRLITFVQSEARLRADITHTLTGSPKLAQLIFFREL